MGSKTTRLGLYKLEDNMPNWHHYYNCNIDIINGVALKIVGLSNVALEGLQNGSILKWSASERKWKVTYSRGK